eukprot:TRINITY_DN3048_c0_g1_i2.p1 TRINITY_DN3048_c0_g1~~TRINITY_DN3048_c0_g1_i2.p1  ORF type:complete len:331 (-),score=95.17 TRINITY_DN3048_c0_g1_i2:20-967(-)
MDDDEYRDVVFGDGSNFQSGDVGNVSDKLLEDAKTSEAGLKLLKASVFMRDAMNDRRLDHKADWSSMRTYIMYHKRAVRAFMSLIVILHLCLAFIEDERENRRWVTALEVVFFLLYLAEVFASYKFMGWEKIKRNRWQMFKLVVIMVSLLEIIFEQQPDEPVSVRRLIRPYFLIAHSRRVKNIMSSMVKALPRVLDVMVLGSFVMILYAIFGVVMFRGLGSEEGQDDYFKDLNTSFISLFVLMTTANYPDVMMPAYRASHFNVFFFMTYLMIILYFLMNLLVAVIYNNYSDNSKLQTLQYRAVSPIVTTNEIDLC